MNNLNIQPTEPLQLTNVFLVPNSVGQLVEEGNKVIFSYNGCIIHDQCTGKEKGRGLCIFDLKYGKTKPAGRILLFADIFA